MRLTRFRIELALALLITVGFIVVTGAGVYFFATMKVHTDPASVPSTPAGVAAERYADAVAEARRLAREVVAKDNLPALSLAVARDGAITWAEAFGWADIQRKTPATPLTRFRIGAVSSPLTSAAVGLLHERGRIDLDAPVQRYVPAYPLKDWPLSTRQVMGHLAGIHRGAANKSERMPGRHCDSLGDVLPLFSDDPLVFRPGTAWRYSTYDWILVSAIVEAAAKEPYLAFMNREVFARVGMQHTVPDAADVPDRASFYFPRMAQNTALGVQDAPQADYSCFAGSGAFVSTPSDLARFGLATLKPGLLKSETIALLQAPVTFESGQTSDYALGWKVESVQLGGTTARMVGHTGSSSGGTTWFMTFPDLGLVVAATANESYATGVAPIGLRIAELFGRVGRDGYLYQSATPP
jgi:serine beta-lactamase-like protein LACTB, mitochondrial